MIRRTVFCLALILLATALQLRAQTPGEVRASRVLEAAKKAGDPELYALLRSMPKGGDVHTHLAGAVYAETIIGDGAREGLCVAPVASGTPAVPKGQDALEFVAPQQGNDCAKGEVPVASAFQDQALYDALVDSFSMRAFVATQGVDGHDQFFATFGRFGALKDNSGEWLDELATRAAGQNEQYLEVMQTPTFARAREIAAKIGWPAGAESSITPAALAGLRDQMIAAGLRDEIAVDRQEFTHALQVRKEHERCDWAQSAAPGCQVEVHFLYQVLRGFPPTQVFAQALLGFEVASVDPDVDGINFVMPEDGYYSMRDYHLQMQMVGYLHSVYPKVHITLHAGELAQGMVPPAGLRFHIRDAVEVGHAERIGHGVDVLEEDEPLQLLHEMAIKHVLVEINLTSNDVILGVTGSDHPLHAYIAAHVPFALSTDDEGVSRIDLTHEYVKAADDQDLSYLELKQSARASLEHSFLHGESLYVSPDDYSERKRPCAAPILAASTPTRACQALLDGSEKAAQQWELERRFAVYERSLR